MRIISGKLKGKSINYIKDSTTRPLKDSVKENIFNVLNHSNLIEINIKEANIFDLYSGIGSFGLECISRGANKVTFIEQNKNTFNILKGNLVALDTTQKLLDRIQTKKITFKVLEGYDKKGLSLSGVLFNSKSNNFITAIYEKNSYKFDDIANVLKKNNIKILDITTEDGDLEDVFVQLTNH